MKPVKTAVFIVVEHDDSILAVKRPESDEDLPGMWGLPATTANQREGIFNALKRAGREKIDVTHTTRFVARGDIERDTYILHGEEYTAEIVEGTPSVDHDRSGTQYTDWQWARPEILQEIARHGSLCAQLYLDHVDINY